ncbi:MAG: endolytic transglycosylase MltG [Holosporales bacterium]|jgi:UPF0755 protein|nr:endolytic transglycosylase MltG [Holosporales bacterium]
MPKVSALLLLISIFLGAVVLLDQSNKDAAVFYVEGDDLYRAADDAGAFKFANIAFVLVDAIPQLKAKIRTGEYAVNRDDTVIDVLRRMFRWQRVRHKFTIPPGWTVLKVINKVQNDNLLFGSISDIPAEGTIMPDTYYYYFGDQKDSIIQKARHQMQVVTMSLKEYVRNAGITLDEILIIASIIEKETASDEERAIVSSVYHNRLRKGMKLESCPTVIYAISGGSGEIHGSLTKENLKFESKFNTYRNKGLPPTPICCPGKESIIAAANPASTEYIFFVAKPQGGGHNFAKTYTEHLENVKVLRTKNRADDR